MDFNYYKVKFWAYLEEIERTGIIEKWTKEQYNTIKNNVKAMAAFVTVLNHRCWYWYDNRNETLSKLYSDLYYKYNEIEWDWLEKHGTEEEKHWYFKTLD